MNCAAYQEDISRYLDDDLSDREEQEMFAHLAGCESCRGFVRDVMQLRNALRRIPAPEPSDSLDRRVLSIPEQWAREHHHVLSRTAGFWKQRLAVPMPAAAAVLLAFLLTTVLALSMWFRPVEQTKPEVRYIMGLPEVEVRGIPGLPAKSVQ